MLKRWDTRNYDIELILAILDSINIDIESMNIPKPRKYDIKTIIKALLVKEFEGLSLRTTEVRVQQLLGVRICRFALLGEEISPLHGKNRKCNS